MQYGLIPQQDNICVWNLQSNNAGDCQKTFRNSARGQSATDGFGETTALLRLLTLHNGSAKSSCMPGESF
jgi:hypothetical protein